MFINVMHTNFNYRHCLLLLINLYFVECCRLYESDKSITIIVFFMHICMKVTKISQYFANNLFNIHLMETAGMQADERWKKRSVCGGWGLCLGLTGCLTGQPKSGMR